MAIGDDAASEGYSLVPESGEDGKVKYGAREINRTRDFIAQLKKRVWPMNLGGTGATNKTEVRNNIGITSGSAGPNNANGENGDIYFKIV